MSDLLRTTVARQVAEAWRDGMSVERSPEDHQANMVDRILGALGELGVDEALVSDDHYVEFRSDGWTIQHALACRPDMLDCEINVQMQADVGRRGGLPEGRYRVWQDDEGDLDFEPVGRAT